jgi:deazaflavin-dependent oxidoreductase (nitroreductase family)
MPNAKPRFEKPTAFDRFFNRCVGALLTLGLAPAYMRRLEVRGRKSGRVFTTPVNQLEMNGRRYLVAVRGETAWVRNARASGRITLRRGTRAEDLAVRELPDDEKPPMLKEFLERYASQVQRFYPVQKGAPLEAFRAMAPGSPVFELIGAEPKK